MAVDRKVAPVITSYCQACEREVPLRKVIPFPPIDEGYDTIYVCPDFHSGIGHMIGYDGEPIPESHLERLSASGGMNSIRKMTAYAKLLDLLKQQIEREAVFIS